MASSLEMYSKFVLEIRLCSAKMVKLVGIWPMAALFQALDQDVTTYKGIPFEGLTVFS